jgi:hypothetical protein
VWFSDAGAPETFGANNWVELAPGDGEAITGMASFGNQLYIFKQSKFYVFFGNSVDGAGEPIFNYRTVAGTGAIFSEGSIVAAVDGVYFIASDGVYRTTGGQPVRISDPIRSAFVGVGSNYFAGSTVGANAGNARLGVTRDRVWLSFSNGSAYLTFIWDIRLQTWLYWDMPATHVTEMPFVAGAVSKIVFSRLDSSAKIMKFVAGQTDDNGAALNGRYRSGFWNPGQPAAESAIREWLIDGSGTVTWKTAVNDKVAVGTGASVALGTAPAIAQGRDRRAVRGRNVSFEVSGLAPWTVSRVVANVRGQRNAAQRSA